MISIDLQEAFDKIDHKILLDKLAFLDFSNSAIPWLNHNFQSAHFIVNVENYYSDSDDPNL